MHTLRNALAAPLLLPCILMAAPALEWRADLADTGAATLYARHGDAVGLRCRLTLRGEPYAPASALCHYQTNGMGAAWWEAPVSLASNVATVAWSPALDPGADLVLLMLEFDGAHRAALHLHLRPGPSGGSAPLPPPTAVLDFAVQPYTNAPWALPADIPAPPDLTPYATTGYVAAAVAAIPAPEPPDLSAYATTGYVTAAVAAIDIPDPDLSAYATTGLVASMHPEFEEYASATFTRVAAEAFPAAVAAEPRGDAIATVGRTSGYALRAIRSTSVPGGMDTESDLEGSWALVAPTDAATLASNVLYATQRPGAATVEFTPALAGAEPVRASVSMPGDAVREATVWPAAESPGAWRSPALDPALYAEASISTSSWNGATYICTNYPASASLAPPWYAPRPPGHGGGLVGLSPHYALSSTHCGEYGPCDWPGGGGSSGRGTSVTTFGDLRLLRMPAEVPAASRARFLRSSTLADLSPSLLFRSLCLAHTQHGGCAPCLVDPRPSRPDLTGATWDGGWTHLGPRDEWRNATWAHLRPLSHAPHVNDSGHPVWFQSGTNAIPVGIFHTVAGSGECLLSNALLDKIDSAIRRDSGDAESLSYYTAADLQP